MCCARTVFWAGGREMCEGDIERDRSLSLLLLAVDWWKLSVKHKKRCPPLRIPSHSINLGWVHLLALCAGLEGGVVLKFQSKYMTLGRNWFWTDKNTFKKKHSLHLHRHLQNEMSYFLTHHTYWGERAEQVPRLKWGVSKSTVVFNQNIGPCSHSKYHLCPTYLQI